MGNTSSNLVDLHQRISKIREDLCMDNNIEFSRKVDINKSYASAICTGLKKAGPSVLEKILEVFPDVSRSWLYFGEGDMIIKNVDNKCDNTIIENNSAPVANNVGQGATVTQTIQSNERDLYERMIKNLEERIEQQAAYIRLLSDEHRGLVHEVINITTDNNTKLSAVQQSAITLQEDISEIKKIGFILENK